MQMMDSGSKKHPLGFSLNVMKIQWIWSYRWCINNSINKPRDHVCYLPLAGWVIKMLTTWEVTLFIPFDSFFVTEFTEFSENHLGKTQLCLFNVQNVHGSSHTTFYHFK